MIVTSRFGRGPAVLWIHGYAMDSTIWHRLWPLLPRWEHVGVDLPGHGRSPAISNGVTLPLLATRLAALADQVQARRVVALSFGCLAAVQLASDHPDTVDRLVLAAPTLGGAEPDPLARRRYQELLALNRLAGPGAALVDRWMQSPPDIFRGTERHPQLRAELREVCLRHSWGELSSGAVTALTSHVHTDDDLAAITARTLVLVGDADMPRFVDNAGRLARLVPACRVLTVQDAGHLSLLERPDAVAHDLATFLA